MGQFVLGAVPFGASRCGGARGLGFDSFCLITCYLFINLVNNSLIKCVAVFYFFFSKIYY